MIERHRKLRATQGIRDLVSNIKISKTDLVAPLFLIEGVNIKEEISSMPGQYRFSVEKVLFEIEELVSVGVNSILLFGIPKNKDPYGSGAYDEKGIIQIGVREIKKRFPDLVIITDVCMCEYTSHGHCGILKNGKVDNDTSAGFMAKIALSHAQAGADIVAPSDMMDGRVKFIRDELERNWMTETAIMSYSVKYASAFYGPFREAAGSTPEFGDRKSYQMDFRRDKEPYLEALADIKEGADIIMVKPALSYLDVVQKISSSVNVPMAVYNVSGEYSMVKAAAKNGWIDEEKVVTEQMYAMKRAGADIIISYFSKEFSRFHFGK